MCGRCVAVEGEGFVAGSAGEDVVDGVDGAHPAHPGEEVGRFTPEVGLVDAAILQELTVEEEVAVVLAVDVVAVAMYGHEIHVEQ